MILGVLAAGSLLIAFGGGLSAARRTFAVGLVVQAVGAAVLAVVGFWALAEGSAHGSDFTGSPTPHLGLDPLSAIFLGTLGLVAAPALVFSLRYLRNDGPGRATGALTAAFQLAMVLLLCARDPFTFLLAWESMTLLPATVILVARRADPTARRTVFTYLAITHLGGAGTWVAILLLADAGGLDDPTVIESGSGLQVAIALAALIGTGTKAGLMPLHAWLPRAHPIAPAPVSALMSGVMIKIALYGLIRIVVDRLGILPVWFGILVLAVGALSAVGGVLHALFQHELKRLLALHSIENVGIIVLGLGACLILRSRGAQTPAALALGAALLHTVNHAVFKSLLFLGAGAFEKVTGTLELDRMGGLLRRLPWTAGAFLVGSMAIAGLPPLNGFASEWLTLQSLLRVVLRGDTADGAAGALGLAALAATAALALLCFAKVVGLVLLGPSRTPEKTGPAGHPAGPQGSGEDFATRASTVFLALTCAVLGLMPGLLLAPAAAVAPWPSERPEGLGLDLPGAGNLPAPGLGLVLFALTALLLLLRGRRTAAPAPTWACGQVNEPALLWTGSGFTGPARVALRAVLRPQREVTVKSTGGVLQEVTCHLHVPQLIDERVYRPVARRSGTVAACARRVQSGSLSVYVMYLIGAVVVLLGAARAGWLG
ncbi:MAG: hydrogenase-4 component [Actinomycetota bacterium]|nr:hydrogenase-4 component [Actinomycetota bacterium]